jgi:hypothetical protein
MNISKVDHENIRIEIFNNTSFTSGNLSKDIPVLNKYFGNPSSTVRKSRTSHPSLTQQRTYSNISQHFSFTMSWTEAGNIIERSNRK